MKYFKRASTFESIATLPFRFALVEMRVRWKSKGSRVANNATKRGRWRLQATNANKRNRLCAGVNIIYKSGWKIIEIAEYIAWLYVDMYSGDRREIGILNGRNIKKKKLLCVIILQWHQLNQLDQSDQLWTRDEIPYIYSIGFFYSFNVPGLPGPKLESCLHQPPRWMNSLLPC